MIIQFNDLIGLYVICLLLSPFFVMTIYNLGMTRLRIIEEAERREVEWKNSVEYKQLQSFKEMMSNPKIVEMIKNLDNSPYKGD